MSLFQQQMMAIECNEDWQQLAYGCRLEATVSCDRWKEDTEVWAFIAVRIYDRLGTICPKPSERYAFADTGMSLRAFMIAKFGPQAGHPTRDPAIVEDWFFERLDLSFEEASSFELNLPSLSTRDFLRVSCLKDRVRLMKRMRPQQMFRRTEELDKWYGLLRPASR